MTFSERYMRSAGVIEAGGRQVKRYHISTVQGHIPEGVQNAAYAFMPQLLPRPDNETPSWMGCVWELAPLGHERAAWIRHVLEPEIPDLGGYLSDVLPDGSTEGRA
jgi:hypothetical protein